MNAYTVNHFEQTIILTKSFGRAAGILNSAAYKTLIQLRHDYPNYDVIQRTITKKADKRSSNRNLTYENMRLHIIALHGKSSKEMEAFDAVVALSKLQTGPYAYVKNWFLEQYPDVRLTEDKNNNDN